MSRQTATVTFQALELKGSLLPASLLEEVSKFNRPKELLLEPQDYGLGKSERLRDRIDAAWVLTKELWDEYSKLKERAGQSIAGQHFGHRLLKEVLGWSGVEPCSGWQQGESHYPITHRAFGGSVPLILRGIDAGALDRGSAQFGQDGRKRSPHSCLQECLNADDSANWGVLLSGDRLRLLHDNPSLVKPAYLTADLELMIEGERFDEFSVLWLLLHASRFQHPKSGSCVLDDWKRKAEVSGERVLGALRSGVQSALESLGSGFLNHPANGALRDALFKNHTLSKQQFHEQLLRLVYRFLFLFTAEDRDLLFPRELKAGDPRRRIYREGYSVSRLRELAIKRSAYEGEYGDLWELQRLVFQQLSIGNSPLGLPGLGGLFSLEQCPDLQGAELWNGPLLRAIKAIGWFDAGGSFTRVRYRDLNTEELGSVYEGLLELHPQPEPKGLSWEWRYSGGAGSDRKTTGSYYTPDALVQELIKSALIPVIDDRISQAHGQAEQEQALLNIKVIDPACGSGHFLLAAARRLAKNLAEVRAGDDQPSEDDRQHALRDVVAHCIYAVDRNPMAVELCKVALWIEAIDPGKPLSFLDAHIQCGDSLVGVFDPKVLEEGIPDEAYKQLTGDDKTVCTSLKKENAAARKTISRRGSNRGIQGSLDLSGTQPRSHGQQQLQAIEAMPETTLAETAAKQAAYANWLADRGRDPETLAADLYTAAYFLEKTSDSRATVPTTEHLLKLLAGQPVEEVMEEAVVQAAQNFSFFHWHLRFGEVMARGAFDCVLGNPPWERIKLQEKEFFAARSEAIATAPNKAAREQLIKALSLQEACESDRSLRRDFEIAKRESEGSLAFVQSSCRYSYCNKGDINTYSVFAELTSRLMAGNGLAGLILPSGLLTEKTTASFLEYILSKGILASAFEFENEGFFAGAGAGHMLRFALTTLKAPRATAANAPSAGFKLKKLADINSDNRIIRLTTDELAVLNPNTRTYPVFQTRRDSKISLKCHSESGVMVDRRVNVLPPANPWNIRMASMYHMTNDSHLFLTPNSYCELKEWLLAWIENEDAELTPLYEAKMIGILNHRQGDFAESFPKRPHILPKINASRLLPNYEVSPFYWVRTEDFRERTTKLGWPHKWYLCWRDVTDSRASARTMIPSVIPWCATGNNLSILMPDSQLNPALMAALIANLSSLPFDYLVRQKVSGLHLNFFMMEQLPILKPDRYTEAELSFLLERVMEATATSLKMSPWANYLEGNVKQALADSAGSRAEIDAFFAKKYGMTREDLRYILKPSSVGEEFNDIDNFDVLERQEIKSFGEYRTQRLVLEAWDRLFGS